MDKPPRRPRLLGVLSLLLLCAACGDPSNANGASGRNGESGSNGSASASCAAPYLSDRSPGGPFRGPVPTVSPGGTLTIYGHWYTSTCNDTGGTDPLRPLAPVRLTLTLPGGDTRELGEFSPSGTDMGFSTDVRVPPAAQAGTATVSDDQQHPATYTFRIGR